MSITLNRIKGSLERVLDKNLQDLVRGIRNHKDCEVVGVVYSLLSHVVFVCCDFCRDGV